MECQEQADSRGVASVPQFGENARNWEFRKRLLPSKLTCTEPTSVQSSEAR